MTKSTLRAIVPRGIYMMVFVLNPFKPVTFSSTAKNKATKKKPLATMLFIQLFVIFYMRSSQTNVTTSN
ncbi:MAG: hypothetical protein ACJAV1_001773 [Paraglaciecola sp.]|jgi:hypothetical protein